MGSLVESSPVLTATSDFPELCVEWLPLHGPFVSDGEWCDITPYVQGGETFCGRQYELEQFQAGNLSLTLNTPTRLFDPEFTTGPFYPYLIPMRQIRVSAVWNSTRYAVWRGYITDWGQTIPAADATFETTIQARDAFALLELIELPSSAWALEVQRDNPSLWFRLGETDTVRVTDSSAGGNYGLYDNATQGAEGLVPNDADGATSFANVSQGRVWIQNPSLISGYPFTFSCMFQVDSDNSVTWKTIISGGGLVDGWQVRFSAAYPGQIVVNVLNGANSRFITTNSVFDDGYPHHLAVVMESASSYLVYVDGTLQSTTTQSTSGTGAPTWITVTDGYFIGNISVNVGYIYDAASGYGFGGAEEGTIDEVVVWDAKAMGASRIAAQALAAKTGWDGDDTGERVGRFLDAIGWSATLRNISTGISILGPASWSAGTSALSVLQDWAATEYGMFFADPQGRLTWYSRHRPYVTAAAMTSQATFGDTHSGETLKYVADGFEMGRDETRIRNPVTASRAGGVTVTARDTEYEEKYGTRTWASPTTQDQLDSAVRDRAVWLVRRYKEIGTRVSAFQLSPRTDASDLWPQALGRAIGDRITIERTPLGTGNQISVAQIIEGVRHRFSPRSWSTTFHCSPVDPDVGNYLILDDATYGLLDTHRTAY